VELVAAIPVVLLLLLFVAQLTVAGYALWTAAAAARAGARAELVGGDAEQAAHSAVPAALGGNVRARGREVAVTVRPPGLPSDPLTARASLDPDG
jgi:hypothetical protein